MDFTAERLRYCRKPTSITTPRSFSFCASGAKPKDLNRGKYWNYFYNNVTAPR
jgi:hypothetical protein